MRARQAALSWAGQHHEEDAAVVLLGDIRDIFDGSASTACRARQWWTTSPTALPGKALLIAMFRMQLNDLTLLGGRRALHPGDVGIHLILGIEY